MKVFDMQIKFNLPTLCSLIAAALSFSSVRAQSSPSISFSDAMGELTRMQQHFLPDSGAYISCHIGYYYSKESTPQQYLDSLTGQYKATATNRYSKIANTETVQNDSMLLVVYNDNHEMLLNAVSPRSANQRSLFINTMDSGFVAQNAESVTLSQSGGIKTMSFQFAASSRFFNCTVAYDASSYLPQSIAYILKASKIAESGKPPADGDLVTIRFTNYSEASFDPSTIAVAKYISLDSANKATLQTAYSGYSIYQGSPRINTPQP